MITMFDCHNELYSNCIANDFDIIIFTSSYYLVRLVPWSKFSILKFILNLNNGTLLTRMNYFIKYMY